MFVTNKPTYLGEVQVGTCKEYVYTVLRPTVCVPAPPPWGNVSSSIPSRTADPCDSPVPNSAGTNKGCWPELLSDMQKQCRGLPGGRHGEQSPLAPGNTEATGSGCPLSCGLGNRGTGAPGGVLQGKGHSLAFKIHINTLTHTRLHTHHLVCKG